MSVDDRNIIYKTFIVMKAIISGTKVSEERIKKRIEICASCPESIYTESGHMKCGICGCHLRGDSGIINLALYEETEDYGCHHALGSKWKNAGV